MEAFLNSEEKLFLQVARVLDSNEKRAKLTAWELNFLLSTSGIFRSISERSTKGLSPKQKKIVFQILNSHGFAGI
ncbi:hypothetical protein PU10_14080 [Escherichia coli]|jgi:hypothetical protein|nr:hypothetical protein PU10_14080 [Escherichia coli]